MSVDFQEDGKKMLMADLAGEVDRRLHESFSQPQPPTTSVEIIADFDCFGQSLAPGAERAQAAPTGDFPLLDNDENRVAFIEVGGKPVFSGLYGNMFGVGRTVTVINRLIVNFGDAEPVGFCSQTDFHRIGGRSGHSHDREVVFTGREL